jgi:putative hemolysin
MPEVDEFSYASADDPRFKRLVIQAIERMSGQPELKRMYLDNQKNPVPGETFWDASIRKLQLKVDYNQEGLGEIPATGPVIVVANHPFGVLDGLVICWLVSRVRKDFKTLTNALLNRADEIKPFVLPIDFEETKAALETNIKTRAEAKALLEGGGALIIFPGGTVSTTPHLLARRAKDPEWKTFTARMIVQGKAPVVPVYFAGQNSRLFQIASHVSMTLRLSLLFKEVHDRIGSEMVLRVGKRIPYDELKAIGDRKKLMEHLRDRTYALAETAPKKLKRRRRRRELVE